MVTRTRFSLAGKMSTPRSVEQVQVQVQVEQMLPLSTSSLGPALLSSSLSGSGSCWGEVGIFQLSGSAQGLKHCRLYSQTTLWKLVSALVWLLLPRRHTPSDIATIWVPIPTDHEVLTMDHWQLFNLILFTSKTINSTLTKYGFDQPNNFIKSTPIKIYEAKWESTIWLEMLQISMSSLSFEVEIPRNDKWHVYIYMYICVNKWFSTSIEYLEYQNTCQCSPFLLMFRLCFIWGMTLPSLMLALKMLHMKCGPKVASISLQLFKQVEKLEQINPMNCILHYHTLMRLADDLASSVTKN